MNTDLEREKIQINFLLDNGYIDLNYDIKIFNKLFEKNYLIKSYYIK